MIEKERAGRNRTLTLEPEEIERYSKRLIQIQKKISLPEVENKIVHQDLFEVLDFLPGGVVDLLVVDPPYNLTKTFNSTSFQERSANDYMLWLEKWLPQLLRTLKKSASVYVCGDWKMSGALQFVLEKYLTIRNRISWEREKGRGAKQNWKNCSEDIWYCTVSDDFIFNVDAVKQKRKVIAPYRQDGIPKDWEETGDGNYRLTHPSNFWTDITIPFWSMPENTDHPTQKPEKLVAKLILASSHTGDLVLDPFLGSGTTAVVSKKLSRRFIGIEIDNLYACLAEKRLEKAETDKSIQGYHDGTFWERNSLQEQKSLSQKIDKSLPDFQQSFDY